MRICRVTCHAQRAVACTRARVITFFLVFPWTVTFLLANSDAHFLNGTHLQPLNLYTLSVGHLGTRKSPAIETVLASLRKVDTITKETLVSAATSSGLVKTTQGKALVASPGLFDILNKLFKNNEDNATDDIQLLCKL